MKVISAIFSLLMVASMIAIVILLIRLLIRFIFRKPCKKIGRAVLFAIGGFVLFATVGILTNPSTWCTHEYAVIEEVAPTCTTKGKIIRQCPLCEGLTAEYPDMLPHTWGESLVVTSTCTTQGYTKRVCTVCSTEDITYIDVLPHSWKTESTVNATCTSGGYTVAKCDVCSTTQKTNETNSLGHSMKEVSRTEPMIGVDGQVVTKCDRCGQEEVKTIAKLKPITIKFDGLELVFGQYSFTTVETTWSSYYGQTVVKIPVTITNLSKDPHSLNMFYYKFFGASGEQSPDLRSYFSDEVSDGGDLLTGKSYTKYLYILYDGDGTYTLVFDNWLYDKKTVEIAIKR